MWMIHGSRTSEGYVRRHKNKSQDVNGIGQRKQNFVSGSSKILKCIGEFTPAYIWSIQSGISSEPYQSDVIHQSHNRFTMSPLPPMPSNPHTNNHKTHQPQQKQCSCKPPHCPSRITRSHIRRFASAIRTILDKVLHGRCPDIHTSTVGLEPDAEAVQEPVTPGAEK